MTVNLSLLILAALLVKVAKCSEMPLKWEDSNGDYTINIDITFVGYFKHYKLTHDKELVVLDLTTFPALNIGRKEFLLRGIFIENCTLPDGVSFGTLFKHLGLEAEIGTFEGINISPQPFSLVGRFSSGFEKVTRLTLRKNNIIKLNESVFESLTELTGLYLSENNISEVHPNVFKKLTKLWTLHLDSNQLKSLSEGVFENQKKMESLNLEKNKLTNLTKGMFRGLCSLRYLSLLGNAISSMDDISNFFPRKNSLFEFDSGIMEVTYKMSKNQSQLKFISLSEINFVDGLQLSGLKELKIELSEVMNLSGLSDIETVKMKNCELSSLNVNSFKSLNSTKKLHLSSNNISNLVDGLFNGLTKLDSLQLSNNKLTEISGLIFGELENLIEIDLSFNFLITIHPNAFDNNKRLTDINLESNQLSFRDGKTPFTHNLEILDLSQNNLTRIPDLLKLNKLKKVTLVDNKISSVTFGEMRQYIVSIKGCYVLQPTFRDRDVHIYLEGNPLKCDCSLYDIASGTDQEQLVPVFSYEYHGSIPCNPKPYVNSQCSTRYACDEISFSQTVISYKGEKLTKLPKIKLINATSIKLDISNNSLVELPLMDPKLNVTFIQASFNQISKIEIGNLPSSLRGLDLSHNQFRTIAPDALRHLKNLANLQVFFFKNNPLECYCSSEDTKQLIKFIDEKGSMTDIQGGKCNEQYDLSVEALQTVCRMEVIVISLTSVTIVVIIFVVILLLFIKHHKFIKMWLYARGWFLWWVDEDYVDREKVYDVFISYEHTNRLLAYRIMYALEKCNIFKVCLHERDFPGGGRIEESVNNAVRNSRRTLVILSEDYLKSVWCEHEFHLAWNRCVAEKRKLIIAVKDGNLGNVADKTIRSYIETHTYIESADEWFFEKLIFRLPHKGTIKNIFPIREWDVIPLDTNESNF